MNRLIFPVLMGMVGIAVLLGLGVWQIQRLALKEARLSAISARITDAPVNVPDHPDPAADKYLAVQATGTLTGQELHILTAHAVGPVYRVIGVLDTGGRKVMADLGYVPLAAKDTPRTGPVTLRGHLHWPDETDGWTPQPEGDIWFSRDVAAMATALGTEPVLIIAADVSPATLGVTPLPIDTSDIPNDHLGYAITWFSLAFVWAVMSGFFIYRIGRRPV